jgi:hypothetical protein
MRSMNENKTRNGEFVRMSEESKRKGKEERLDWWNEDILLDDDDEEEKFIDYVCTECGCIDPVPEFIVEECAWDYEEGEMIRKKEKAEG